MQAYRAPNSMYARLLAELKKILTGGIVGGQEAIKKAVMRHRVKLLEALEDNPQEYIADLLLPDAIFSKTEIYKQNGNDIGRWFTIMSVLDELEGKTERFWLDLLNQWIVSANKVEVIMKPDARLAKQMSEGNQQKINHTVQKLGQEGLRQCQIILENAIEDNNKKVPDHLFKFPPIPSPEKISAFPVEVKVFDPPSLPFPVQLVSLPTQFCHIRISFYIKNLPNELRPYLVLFQELLLETDIEVVKGNSKKCISYKDVVQQLSEQTVSMECGVGFGNQTFSCDGVPEIFHIYGVVEVAKYKLLCKWICNIIFGAKFPVKRIQSVATNLLADAHEESRDGPAVADALYYQAMEPVDLKPLSSNCIHEDVH